MSFIWPEALWLMCLLPALVAAYLWMLGRRRNSSLRWSSLTLVRPAGSNRRWWRHTPAALLLIALGALVIASARPMAHGNLYMPQQTMLLVMDTSASMLAKDVLPSRLAAEQAAAKALVADLPPGVRVAVVSYAGTAHLAQAPTRHRDGVMGAIDALQPQPGTAIGSGLLLALSTEFPNAGLRLERFKVNRADLDSEQADPIDAIRHSDVEPGSYPSAVIVLLSDGQNTAGANPMEVADAAADLGIKVYTVGLGTRDGDVLSLGGWAVRVKLDEETLSYIAAVTGGEYFYAADAKDLKRAYLSMQGKMALERADTEVSGAFAMIAALAVLIGSALSLCKRPAKSS